MRVCDRLVVGVDRLEPSGTRGPLVSHPAEQQIELRLA